MDPKTQRLISDITTIAYPLGVPILGWAQGQMTGVVCVLTCVFIVIGGVHNLLKTAPKDRESAGPDVPIGPPSAPPGAPA